MNSRGIEKRSLLFDNVPLNPQPWKWIRHGRLPIVAASPHSNSWARIIFSSERKEGRGGKDRRGSREDTDAALRARSLACRALFGYQGVSSPPTLAAIPLSFRSLFSSLNAPVVLSIEPIVCPPNTFNDLNPTQRSAMSAALRVLSA